MRRFGAHRARETPYRLTVLAADTPASKVQFGPAAPPDVLCSAGGAAPPGYTLVAECGSDHVAGGVTSVFARTEMLDDRVAPARAAVEGNHGCAIAVDLRFTRFTRAVTVAAVRSPSDPVGVGESWDALTSLKPGLVCGDLAVKSEIGIPTSKALGDCSPQLGVLDSEVVFAFAAMEPFARCQDVQGSAEATLQSVDKLFYDPAALLFKVGRRESIGSNVTEAVFAEFAQLEAASRKFDQGTKNLGLLSERRLLGGDASKVDEDADSIVSVDGEDEEEIRRLEMRGLQALRLEPVGAVSVLPPHVQVKHGHATLPSPATPANKVPDHAVHLGNLADNVGHPLAAHGALSARVSAFLLVAFALWLVWEAHSGGTGPLQLLQRTVMNDRVEDSPGLPAVNLAPAGMPTVLYVAIPFKTTILAVYPACFIGIMHAERWSLGQLALTATFARIAGGVGSVFWGVLVDSKHGLGLWTATALAALAVGLFGVAMAPSPSIIAPFLCLVAGSATATTPISQAAAKVLLPPEERASLFGRIQSLSNTGYMAGTALGLVVGDSYVARMGLPGWRAIYLAASACAALLAVFAVLETGPETRRLARTRSAGAAIGADKAADKVPLIDRLRALAGRSVYLIVAHGAVSSSASDALAFVPTWLRYQGLGSWSASAVWSCWYISSSLGSLSASMLSDRTSSWRGNQGRVAVAVYSTTVILFMPWLIFLSTQLQGWQYCALLVLGFHVDIAYVAAARPVLAEVVSGRATATAEGVRQSFAALFASGIGNYFIVALAARMGAGSLIHGGGASSASEAAGLGYAILFTHSAMRLVEVVILVSLFFAEGEKRVQATARSAARP